jgi:hypothetical protein
LRKKRWPGSAFSPQSDSRRRVEREGLKKRTHPRDSQSQVSTLANGQVSTVTSIVALPNVTVSSLSLSLEARKKRWPGSAFSPQSDSRRRVEREGLKKRTHPFSRLYHAVAGLDARKWTSLNRNLDRGPPKRNGKLKNAGLVQHFPLRAIRAAE